MHLSESESGGGTSLSELANKCEVEEEVVRNCMTYWIARGVVSESRDRRREIDVENIISGATTTATATATASGTTNNILNTDFSSSVSALTNYTPSNPVRHTTSHYLFLYLTLICELR